MDGVKTCTTTTTTITKVVENGGAAGLLNGDAVKELTEAFLNGNGLGESHEAVLNGNGHAGGEEEDGGLAIDGGQKMVIDLTAD